MKFCKNCQDWVQPIEEDHGYGVTEFWGHVQDHVLMVEVCPQCKSQALDEQTECAACGYDIQECDFYSIEGDFFCMECGSEHERDYRLMGINTEGLIHVIHCE